MNSHAAVAAVVLGLLAALGTVPRAHAVPFDAVTTLVSTNASGLIHFQRNVPGPASEVSSQTLLISPDHYSSTAIAFTSGLFGSPTLLGPTFLPNLGLAHASAHVENLDRPTIHTTARASATFVYFLEVLGPAGGPVPPGSPPVDVHIDWHLEGSADGVGFGSAQILVEILTALRPGGGLIQLNKSVINGTLSGIDVVHVDLTDSLPNHLRVELRAQCGTSGLEGAFVAECSATADPTFFIPSDFPNASQFRLVFSPNLAPAASVPEPPAISLSLLTLAGLVVADRVRSMRRRQSRR